MIINKFTDEPSKEYGFWWALSSARIIKHLKLMEIIKDLITTHTIKNPQLLML